VPFIFLWLQLEGDFSDSFAIQPKTESESLEEDGTETKDDDASSRPNQAALEHCIKGWQRKHH
jgi:hypothetical protein